MTPTTPTLVVFKSKSSILRSKQHLQFNFGPWFKCVALEAYRFLVRSSVRFLNFMPSCISNTCAVFMGVRALFDYPRPDWILCWHRPASTQRNGRIKGFNNWEPIAVYGNSSIPNDTVSTPNTEHETGHESQKPIRLMTWLLNTLRGETILDPFSGSGTTLRAAKDLGRKSIGIEIEERYCEIAAKRLAQEVLPLTQTTSP